MITFTDDTVCRAAHAYQWFPAAVPCVWHKCCWSVSSAWGSPPPGWRYQWPDPGHTAALSQLMASWILTLPAALDTRLLVQWSTYSGAPWRLVNHNAGIRKRVPHARRPCSQEQAAHAGRLADAPGGDGIEDVLHRVINGQACCYHTTLER